MNRPLIPDGRCVRLLLVTFLVLMALLIDLSSPTAIRAQHPIPPGKPNNVAVIPGDGKLTITWEAPSSSGSTDPKGYQIDWCRVVIDMEPMEPCTDHEKHVWNQILPDLNDERTSYEFTGTYRDHTTPGDHTVTNGQEYALRIRAVSEYPGEERESSVGHWVRVTGTPTATTPIVLTITPNQTTRVYGGTEDLGFSVGGLLDGNTKADVVSGTELSRTAGDDVDSYTLSLDGLSINSGFAGKYALPSAPASTTYTITKREITDISGVTVFSRNWDGTTAATFDTSSATGTGVLPGELSDFQGGGLVVAGNFPEAAKTAAGTYTVNVTYSLQDNGSFKAGNYSIATSDRNGSLSGALNAVLPGEPRSVAAGAGPQNLTVTWVAPASNGGAAITSYRVRWRTAQVGQPGDQDYAATGNWQDDNGEDVGDVLIYIISSLVSDRTYDVQAAAVNSAGTGPFAPVTPAQGTPTAAALIVLTITPNQTTRVYGDTEDLGFSVGRLVDGDMAAVVVSGTTLTRTPPGNDVGSYTLSLSGLSINSGFVDKYALPSAPASTSYTITRREITAISGVTVNTRRTDGTTTATFNTSRAQGTGVLAADLADFRDGGLVVSGAFPSASPGTYDVSVTYSLQDHGAFKAANYMLSATTATLRGTISSPPTIPVPPVATPTPTPSPTPTPTPAATPTPTPAATPTPTPAATPTPTPAPTPTPTPEATPTPTPAPTLTPTPAPTLTPTPTLVSVAQVPIPPAPTLAPRKPTPAFPTPTPLSPTPTPVPPTLAPVSPTARPVPPTLAPASPTPTPTPTPSSTPAPATQASTTLSTPRPIPTAAPLATVALAPTLAPLDRPPLPRTDPGVVLRVQDTLDRVVAATRERMTLIVAIAIALVVAGLAYAYLIARRR